MVFSKSRFIAFASVLLLATVFVSGCSGPEPVKPPTGFSDFVSPDKTFAGKGPDGWKKDEAGVQGGMQGSVTFQQGTAQVSISSDMMGSLTADISRGNNATVDNVAGMLPEGMQAQLPKVIPPVEKLHKAGQGANEKRYTDYEEKPMQMVNAPIGEGRVSEFTGEKKDGFTSYKVHGYRATFLTVERRVMVICRCTEADWKALSPGFGKVLAGLANGPG